MHELIDDLLVEAIVAAELLIAPDARVLAEELGKPDVQGLRQRCDPPLLTLAKRPVVDVRVANEDVVVEFHR